MGEECGRDVGYLTERGLDLLECAGQDDSCGDTRGETESRGPQVNDAQTTPADAGDGGAAPAGSASDQFDKFDADLVEAGLRDEEARPPLIERDPDSEGGTRRWAFEIVPILPAPEPRADFPVEALGSLLPVVEAVRYLTGCSVPVAATSALGSLNIAAQADWNVRTLASKPAPVSLFFEIGAESTNRKSAAMDLVVDPHLEADKEAKAKWREAKKMEGEDAGAEDVLDNMPIVVRSDPTSEAVVRRLEGGRASQALVNSDAVEFTENWSGQAGRRSRTMGTFNKLWDGQPVGTDRASNGGLELMVYDRRFAVLIASQPNPMREWHFSPESANGWSGRSLVTVDDERPSAIRRDPDGEFAASRDLGLFTTAIRGVRSRQDEGAEFKPKSAPAFALLEMSAEALDDLWTIYEETIERHDAALERGDQHAKAFWGRAPELTARMAATLYAYDRYLEGAREAPADGVIGETYIADAKRIIYWYGEEQERVGGTALATELAAAANRMSEKIAEAGAKYADTRGELAMGTFINRARPFTPSQMGDPEFKRRVIDLLVAEGHLAEGSMKTSGRKYLPHPQLRARWPQK